MTEAAYGSGDFDAVGGLLSEALRRSEAGGDRRSQADALDQLGVLRHFRTIDRPRAEWPAVDPGPEQELFERALAIRRELDDSAGVAESLLHLGWVHQVLRNQPEAALPLFTEALALAEPDGDEHVRAELHRHLGFHLLLAEGRPEEALPHFRTSLDFWRTCGDPALVVFALAALARCESTAGMHRDALEHSREALDLARAGRFRRRVTASAEEASRAVEKAAAAAGG